MSTKLIAEYPGKRVRVPGQARSYKQPPTLALTYLRVTLSVGRAFLCHGDALLVDGPWQVALLTRAALANKDTVGRARVDALAVEGHQPGVTRAVSLGSAVAVGRARLHAGTVEGFKASLE